MRKLFRICLTLLTAGFVFSAVPLAASDYLAHPVSDYGENVTNLLFLLLTIAGAVFFLIVGIMAIILIRFRAKKPGEEGVRTHGHTVLEIVWTVVPFVIVFILAGMSVNLTLVQAKPPADALIVKVIGYQFGWDFEYYQTTSNTQGADVTTVKNICGNPAFMVTIKNLHVKTTTEFQIPQGVPVRFLVTSKDVVHSFWVPDFMIKKDTLPQYVADFWLTPRLVGEYPVVCAALCGSDHATMTGKVKIVPKNDFDTWLAAQQAAQAQEVKP